MMSTPIADGNLCILILITGIKKCKMSLMALKATFINLKIIIKTHILVVRNENLLGTNLLTVRCNFESNWILMAITEHTLLNTKDFYNQK